MANKKKFLGNLRVSLETLRMSARLTMSGHKDAKIFAKVALEDSEEIFKELVKKHNKALEK